MPDEDTAVARHAVDTVLDVTCVDKRFDNGVLAVEDVSLQVRRSEFVALVGPSGCGKSTVLRMLAGLIAPTRGSIELNGSPVSEPRADVGMMFQRPTLFPWKTALENVLLPRRLRRSRSGPDRDEARGLLSMLGLGGFEHAYPRHLSGGMQQRVALARLLITGADVLLLDEPFAAVDELNRERLNLELVDLHDQRDKTTVLVTHSIQESVLMADRIFVMSARPGRIAAVVPVPLDRPRRIEMTAMPELQRTAVEVRQALGHIPR